MYVKKFEAETLEDALKAVKLELGPDAIILKTTSNKGLKGALKKRSIEITAAISEDDYSKKMNLDKVLSTEQKQEFYRAPSKDISKVIHQKGQPAAKNTGSYGSLGLNRSVKAPIATNEAEELDLSDFLNEPNAPMIEDVPAFSTVESVEQHDFVDPVVATQVANQDKRIAELEEKLTNMHEEIRHLRLSEEKSTIGEFQKVLKSFDLSEQVIRAIQRKIIFELSDEEISDEDIIYDIAVREILTFIKTETAQFTRSENFSKSIISILVSDGSCGQSTTAIKLAALGKGVVISYGSPATNTKFYQETLGIEVKAVNSVQEMATAIKHCQEAGKNVFLDLKVKSSKKDETKKLLNSLRSSFKDVEILLCLSAIHSENYNNKVCKKYENIANGIVVTQIDLCMNISALVNLQMVTKLPYYFFGTGEVVPKDIEEASADKLIARIFNI